MNGTTDFHILYPVMSSLGFGEVPTTASVEDHSICATIVDLLTSKTFVVKFAFLSVVLMNVPTQQLRAFTSEVFSWTCDTSKDQIKPIGFQSSASAFVLTVAPLVLSRVFSTSVIDL